MGLDLYFGASIRGGRDDADIYAIMVEHLKSKGHNVLTEHVGDVNLTPDGEERGERYIHDRDIEWLKKSQALIMEVTNPSLGVGYEIRAAIELGIPVLALYRPTEGKKLSAMVLGSPDVEVRNYQTIKEMKKETDSFLEKLVA